MSNIDVNCKVCGRKITWFNDIPLKGYCWGTEEKEHKEYKVVIDRNYTYPQNKKKVEG
jgi:hypothetical protein